MTFEYSLVGGVNDHPEDARRLAALAKPIHSHINLIPVNPVTERSFVQPKKEVIGNFKKELEKYGINVTESWLKSPRPDGIPVLLIKNGLIHSEY